MDNIYYAKTFYRHVVPVGTTENKKFIPMYNEITKEQREFVLIDWSNYYDKFGAP